MHVSMEYFGQQRPPSLDWTIPAANFSHVLSIYDGHFLDMLFHVAGQPKTVSAVVW
jgi:predicted dehydrogenase